jgi:hypothetical protein
MLGAMDTGAAAWIVVGFLLGVAVLALAGLAVLAVRGRRRPAAEPEPVDDLPAFLETPPGTAGAARPSTGWTSLSSLPPPAAPAPAPARRGTALVLGGAAVVALLTAVLVLATTDRGGGGRDSAHDRASDALRTRLAFAGIVLEQRAVGVTVAYPRLEVTEEDGATVAHLELPAFNCLTAEAPTDPDAAGCTPTLTEYADLTSPELAVDRDGDDWALSGSFATEHRPNGGPAEATGHTYDLRVTVVPAEGQTPEAVLHLGDDRVESVDGEISGG